LEETDLPTTKLLRAMGGASFGANTWRRSCVLVACLLVLAVGAAAQPARQKEQKDLTQMTLEDLLKIEVTSVSRRGKRVSEATSAVYVITQEDIRRSGATSIPEALRMAPGVHVAAFDANKWAVSIRGFNGRFADKLLVMVDGRSVYSPLFSGTFWEVQDTILEDIERIEVIRGPGGTMWGSNAVNGVINIITKHSRETQGGLVSAGAGNQEGVFGGVRFGGSAGTGLHYRAYSKYFNHRDDLLASGERAGDEWDVMRGGFRLDWDRGDKNSLMLSGEIYDADVNGRFSLPSRQSPFQQVVKDDAALSGGHLLGRWTRSFSDRSTVALRAYFDTYERSGITSRQRVDSYDFDAQHEWQTHSSNRLIWGGGYRHNKSYLQGTDFISFGRGNQHTKLGNAFLQDEWWLWKDRLALAAGSKFEHNSYTGWEVQPNASLLGKLTPSETVWASVARAVRIPFLANRDMRVNLAAFPGPGGEPAYTSIFSNPEFVSEELTAYQAGLRTARLPRISFDLALFYHSYDYLQSTDPEAPFIDPSLPGSPLVIPSRFQNSRQGETYGAELAAVVQVSAKSKLASNYSWLRVDVRAKPGSSPADAVNVVNAEVASPRHQFHARWFQDLPGRMQFDTAYYFTGGLAQGLLRSYHRVDCRIGWIPSAKFDFSFALQNMLDNQHPEAVAFSFELPSETGRSLYGKVTWRF
jgi:iron complex outermembrane receptor protein